MALWAAEDKTLVLKTVASPSRERELWGTIQSGFCSYFSAAWGDIEA